VEGVLVHIAIEVSVALAILLIRQLLQQFTPIFASGWALRKQRDSTRRWFLRSSAVTQPLARADVDFTVDASLPIAGLTAWQGLFEHGRLRAGGRGPGAAAATRRGPRSRCCGRRRHGDASTSEHRL